MRKLLATLAALGVVAAMATPAMAGTDQDTATLTVTVEQFVDITFSDNAEAFGVMLNGATKTADDALKYTTNTNASGTGKITVTQAHDYAVGAGNSIFTLQKGTMPSGGGSGVGEVLLNGTGSFVWYQGIETGQHSYTDDVVAAIGATRPPGDYTTTLTYVYEHPAT